MPELTFRKRLNVVKLYLDGFSHEVIAEKTGVAKGSVTNIIEDLLSTCPNYMYMGSPICPND